MVPNVIRHQAAVLEVAFLVQPSATAQCFARPIPEANRLGDRPSLATGEFQIIYRTEACTGDVGVICPRLSGHLKPSSNIHAVKDPSSCGIQQLFVPLPRALAGRTSPAEVPDPPAPEGDEDEKLNSAPQEGHATGVPQPVEYKEDFTVEVAKYSPLEAQDPVIVVKRVLDIPVWRSANAEGGGCREDETRLSC
ncbi:hypothetical protein BDQ17DRAFT_244022 [Cyathus striatus]|nr:hypothetical protein BDQ17DRAFT_244022 [Cyathus striatus]